MSGSAGATHPWRFALLIVPYGASGGFLTVTMAWLLTAGGVAPTDTAALIALSYLPHTWKFLWAPLVDLTWHRKGWYLLGSVGGTLGTWATGALPANSQNLVWLSVVVLATNFAVTLLGMSVESLMAHATADGQKGRAAGWFQAGNLGGLGVGGGAGLWMVQGAGLSPGASAAVLAASGALCALALSGMPDPSRISRVSGDGAGIQGWVDSVRSMLVDLWAMARSRRGALAILVCFLPIGSGAAANMWSVAAGDWGAGANTVALVNGTLGGVISALGCLVGGFVCDRMDRQRAYCVFGGVMVATALVMWALPRVEASFVAMASVYAFVQGLTYAGFSAVVLEAIGRGVAATKYNLLASLSNMPIAWVTVVDGWGYERHGTTGLLLADSATGICGLLVFAAVAFWMGTRRQAA